MYFISDLKNIFFIFEVKFKDGDIALRLVRKR